MPRLPTGTVTFLFTDVEGSTRLLAVLLHRLAVQAAIRGDTAPVAGWERELDVVAGPILACAGSRFEAARTAGRRLLLDEAVARALEAAHAWAGHPSVD